MRYFEDLPAAHTRTTPPPSPMTYLLQIVHQSCLQGTVSVCHHSTHRHPQHTPQCFPHPCREGSPAKKGAEIVGHTEVLLAQIFDPSGEAIIAPKALAKPACTLTWPTCSSHRLKSVPKISGAAAATTLFLVPT